MARIRSIKPEFWADEKLTPLDPFIRFVFLGLICQADDLGRLVDNVRLLDGLLFSQTEEHTVREALVTLSRIGRIKRGKTASGQSIIQIVNWSKHQRVDHPNLLAALPEIVAAHEVAQIPEALANDSRMVREALATDSRLDLRSTINDQRPTINDQRTNSSEPPEAAASEPPTLVIGQVESFPCIKRGRGADTYHVSQSQAASWAKTYPAVDVPFELTKMRTWIEANPTKRKTFKGYPAFVVRWLSKVQDHGGSTRAGPSGSTGGAKSPSHRARADAEHENVLTAIEAKGGQDPYGKNRELVGDDHEALFGVHETVPDDRPPEPDAVP